MRTQMFYQRGTDRPLSGWQPMSAMTQGLFGPIGNEFVTVKQLREATRSNGGEFAILLLLLLSLTMLMVVEMSRIERRLPAVQQMQVKP